MLILAIVTATIVQVNAVVAQVASGATLTVLRGTVALVRGTTLGHRVDDSGNVTVYLINSNNTVLEG